MSHGKEVLALTRELCEFSTGLVAEDNERLFQRLAQELPLHVHRWPSGSEHNGWIVPQLWKVRKAQIRKESKVLFDGTAHPLGVATYSKPFRGRVDAATLREHVATSPQLPEAYLWHCLWAYRPWQADWAFSIPHEQYRAFGEGPFEVDLDTTYEPGELLVAEAEHRGSSDRTIVFNAHTCHPRMANDDFAGVAVLVHLFRWLQGRKTRYTYRLILGPEHLGTVFYLRDRAPGDLQRLVGGAFAEMPGTRSPVKVASSFLGDQVVDRVFRHVAKHHARAPVFVPWRQGAGNDETVWEAPGYEVPFVEVSRSEALLEPYREYHTSLDSPELMDEAQLEEFFRVFAGAVQVLEENAVPRRTFDGLVCLSNPKYDLYVERADPAIAKDLPADSEAWGHLLDCLPRYLDGSMTLLDIAEKHGLPFERVAAYLAKFQAKGLVELTWAPVERRPVQRMAGSSGGRKAFPPSRGVGIPKSPRRKSR